MDRRNLLRAGLAAPVLATLALPEASARSRRRGPRSVIFLHPDGMGANTWMAVRLADVGPDGRLAWDRLPAVAAYVGPMIDSLTASSNGGATSHAWGVRAHSDSYGQVGGARIARALSGASDPIGPEALGAGKAVGLVNSATITEPGTGAMIADVANRRDHAAIAAQLVAAAPQVMLGGGEAHFLPAGSQGRHGAGRRTDGRNLIEEARAKGYTVVFTAQELAAIAPDTPRLLGLFAEEDCFNDGSQADMAARGVPIWQPQAPTYDVMVEAALRILIRARQGYLLVANHEATDNLGGDNNARGVIEGGIQADRAIAAARRLAERDPNLTIVVASDSDCGGLNVLADDVVAGQPVPPRNENGAPHDGADVARTPFLAAPDRAGRRLPFAVAWASEGDLSGGTIARAQGPGAVHVSGTIDSTDIYRAVHFGLFGRRI